MSNPDSNSFNLKVLLLLSLGHLITDIYQGALPALLPFLKEKLSLSYAMAAMIMMTSNLTSSVIQPLFGYFSDKQEKLFLLPLGCFAAGLGLSLIAVPSSYYATLLLVTISGLGVASYHPEGYKTAHFFTGGKMATGMSVFSVGGNLGFALGPIIAVYIVNLLGLNYLPLMIVFAIVFVVLIYFFRGSLRIPEKTQKTVVSANSQTTSAAYFALFLVVMTVIVRSWTQMGLMTFLPFYYIDVLQGDSLYAGKLVSVFLLGGVVGTIGGSIIADRVGHYHYLVVSMFLSGLLLPTILYVSGPWLFLVLGIIGTILISTFTVTIVMAQKIMPGHLGMASGLMVGFAIGTGGIGATVIGIIADYFGLRAALQMVNILPMIGFFLSIVLFIYARKRHLVY